MFFREPLTFRLYVSLQIDKYEPFKEVFKDCDRKFTQSISGTHVFITQSLCNERLSVSGYSVQTLPITFRRKNLRMQVLANILWTFFLLMMKL